MASTNPSSLPLPTPPTEKVYTDHKTQKSSKKQIIIIGAGIIGVCTAFYLTRLPSYDPSKYHITIIESRHPASGTTAKAAGLVVQWAFPRDIVPLSFRLHTELSDEFDGPTNWDYRPLTALSLEGGLPQLSEYDRYASSKTEKVLPEDLNWVRRDIIQNWYKLGSEDDSFLVNPYKLTHCLLDHILARDDVSLVLGHVVEINKLAPLTGNEDKFIAESVTYIPTGYGSRSDPESRKIRKILYGDKIIVTTGPWVGSLVNNCPVVGLQTRSMIVSQPEAPESKLSAYGLYTDFKIKHTHLISPEFYSRKSDIYIFGESVRVHHIGIHDYCRQVIPSSIMEQTKVLRTLDGHIPVINSAACEHLGPFIGCTNTTNLYLAAGHGCWGITNGPATGLLLAEIVLEGNAKSADITDLDPKLYFST
ncbi:nucleotide-binding domain-containing protein [Nadsonia fulvescens var. elongata DSM 6958]|uniref:Nucleotide-binding domain-containing protein n=1 Tax=Nadsonia fulvescens var. elongata DSM 6958 TaxID=857566 RepID=A0A1E3PQP0_9ASCO|nr:nucleotide-binding domain-containing protein [Nadsonia fulvescens var. elongata DSM 6958]